MKETTVHILSVVFYMGGSIMISNYKHGCTSTDCDRNTFLLLPIFFYYIDMHTSSNIFIRKELTSAAAIIVQVTFL